MAKVEVDTRELAEFEADLREFSRDFQRKILLGSKLAVMEMEGELVNATPHGATGIAGASWYNELDVKSSPFGTTIVRTIENKQLYVTVQNLGRKAGPWSSPPPWRDETHGLGLWTKRVLGLSGAKAKRAAYLISRKIFRKGISGKHEGFVEKAVAKSLPKVKKILELTFYNALKGLMKP